MTDGAPGRVLAPGACAPDDLAVEYDYFAGSKTGYPAAVPPLGAPSGEDSPGVTSATGWPPGPAVPAPPPPPIPPVGAGVPAQQAWPPGTTPIAIDEQMMLTSSAAKSYQNMTGKPGYYLPGSRLGFFGSIRVGFQLIPVCWSVLAQELMLLIVPLVVLLIGALALLGYAAAFGGVDGLVADDTAGAALRLVPIGVLLMVLSVVGQAIIVAAATEILNGKRSTFGAAWLAVCVMVWARWRSRVPA